MLLKAAHSIRVWFLQFSVDANAVLQVVISKVYEEAIP